MYILNSALASQLTASAAQLTDYPYTSLANQDFASPEKRSDFYPFNRKLGPGRDYYLVHEQLACDLYDEEIDSTQLRSNFHQQIGTYMVHGELLFAVSEFTESAYAKPMPWQSQNCNYNIELQPLGRYRSFFMKGAAGNYENFYDMCPISRCKSYYSDRRVPNFYTSEQECTETTISPTSHRDDYKEYKPFISENLGYSRSYFYGMNY